MAKVYEPRGVERSGRSVGEGSGRTEEDHQEAGRVAAQDHPDPGQEVRATELQEQRRAAIWKATDALIVRQERIWERSFRRLFADQQKATLARLEGNARSKKIAAMTTADEVRAITDPPFDPAYWQDRTEQEARALYEQLASQAFARLEGDFGVSFDLEAEFAQLFINNRANQLAGQVTIHHLQPDHPSHDGRHRRRRRHPEDRSPGSGTCSTRPPPTGPPS